MREVWARRLVSLTGILVVALAIGFAALRNLPDGPHEGMAADADVADGMRVYEEQGCAQCHSIAGAGNPRNPLDGIGSRLSASDIRGRIVGAPEQKDSLPAGPFRIKQAYQDLPAREIDALVAYMQSLR